MTGRNWTGDRTAERLSADRMIAAARWIALRREKTGALPSRRAVRRRFNLTDDRVDDAILHANAAQCRGQ